MLHNSDDHREHVSFCWNFQRGECDYKNNCWFIHEKKDIIIDKFKIQNKFIKTEGKNLYNIYKLVSQYLNKIHITLCTIFALQL